VSPRAIATVQHVAGMVMGAAGLGSLVLRYLVPWTEAEKKRAALMLVWPLAVAGLIYTWLAPWTDQGPNANHIMVYIALGIGAVGLVDHVVDRYRARRGREAPSR